MKEDANSGQSARGQVALSTAIARATAESLTARSGVDAIVVGSGATGGLAAQLLTEAGLTVLVLDAGGHRSRLAALSTRLADNVRRSVLGREAFEARLRTRQPIQSQCYAWAGAPRAFVDDVDNPYTAPSDKPFVWLRSRQLGGRIVIPGHGRQYYRLGPRDFQPMDGRSEPWPFDPGALDEWYSVVERQLALAGRRENSAWIPDSEIARTLTPSADEDQSLQAIEAHWPGIAPILGRFGTPPPTLERAAETGRLLVRSGAVAKEIRVNRAGAVSGVTWIDQRAAREIHVEAPLVFLCASTLESTRLLLLSKSHLSPNGIGSGSNALGHYLMDHMRVRMNGHGAPLSAPSKPEPGRCVYIPRFDTRQSPSAHVRGFGVQVYRSSGPGDRSSFVAAAFGEMLPRHENRVCLDEARKDVWGIPTLRIECAHGDDDLTGARDQVAALKELADLFGVKPVRFERHPAPPGSANHECGTARMGPDAGSSVLDPHNECWEARGLFLTDGACMPSQGIQNPTLTYLALTARACSHALRRRT